MPKEDRDKTISLRTSDSHTARDHAFDLDAEIRFKLNHNMPIFNRLFRDVAEEYISDSSIAKEMDAKSWLCSFKSNTSLVISSPQ